MEAQLPQLKELHPPFEGARGIMVDGHRIEGAYALEVDLLFLHDCEIGGGFLSNVLSPLFIKRMFPETKTNTEVVYVDSMGDYFRYCPKLNQFTFTTYEESLKLQQLFLI